MSSAQLEKFALVKPAEIEWRDGLPFSLEFDDVYFSIHGAVEESTHVFINGNQLTSDWKLQPDKNFTIAELGFGSGLNFLNTVSHWLEHQSKTRNNPSNTNPQHLHYVAIEKRPFSKNDLIKVSQLWPQFSIISEQLICHYPSQTYGRHQLIFASWNITLTLLWMPLEDALNDLIQESKAQENKTHVEYWFLDGFAPQKNSSMWDESNAEKIAKLSKLGSRIATYSVAGTVKRPLIKAGFKITKFKGFAKKREMLTAVFQENINQTKESKFINIKYEMPWFNINKLEKNRNSNVAIIGAGIAGCSTAYCLANKGFSCDIYESSAEIASGASGAAAGIFHPQLTSDMSFSSQFSWLAYLALLRFLSSLTTLEKSSIIINEGVHRFLESEGSKQKLIDLAQTLKLSHWIKEDPANCSNETIKSNRNVYFPHSAVLDMPALCQLYLDKIKDNLVNVYINSKVTSIVKTEKLWQVSLNNQHKEYQHVVYCAGAKSNLLTSLNLSDTMANTNATRGQTCHFESSSLAENVQQTLSDKIYLAPYKTACQKHQLAGNKNQFLLGASFDELDDLDDKKLNQTSQNEILYRGAALLKELSIPFYTEKQMSQLPLKGSLGYRLHANDRLPIVGAAIEQQKIINEFSGLGQKQILRENLSNYNQEGLWVNTAYGSHGLLYSLLASQHLTSLISHTISPLETKISNQLHPARFLVKALKNAAG